MVDRFWEEAERYEVLPIMDDAGNLAGTGRLFAGHSTPGTPKNRDEFTYLPPTPRVPPDAGPALGSRNWTMRFDVERPDGEEAGVLLAVGTVNNGLVAYVDQRGHLVYDHNAYGNHTVLRSPSPVPTGRSVLEVHQDRVRQGPGRVRLVVDGTQVGEESIPEIPTMISPVGLDVGRNPTGVSSDYEPPFAFQGRIHRVDIATRRAFRKEDEAAIELAAAERME